MTEIIAFYLPQFHYIEENNRWWGEYFTEWTNVKKAKPLYKKHLQPRQPIDDNYYLLDDLQVMERQAKMANEYGIDAFCFYHYWFNGKKLLQKPIEGMLKNKDIDIKFCLSWANETWSRRWNGKNNEILIEQKYGNSRDWEKHILYLLDFFKDSRYLKINNRPVFLIYRIFDIPECERMISNWENILKENGFDGLYLIEMMGCDQKRKKYNFSSACLEFEPMYTVYNGLKLMHRMNRYAYHHLKMFRLKFRDILLYDDIWDSILKRKDENQRLLGAFPGWDNTPRRGVRGLIIEGSSPEKFEKYLKEQYKKSIENNKPFLFINAWNEWGEGAFLEPDKKYRYKYLEAVRNVKLNATKS